MFKDNNGMEIYVRMVFYGGYQNINDQNYYSDYQLNKKLDFTSNEETD